MTITRHPAGGVGSVGPPGESAYQLALDNGFVGTEAAWLDSLIGPRGLQGPPGAPGAGGSVALDGSLLVKSDGRMYTNAASTLGTQIIQPEQPGRDTDGTYFCTATFTKLDGTITCGWIECAAGSDPRVASNWHEAGAMIGVTGSADAPEVFLQGSTWYALIGGKGTGAGVRLFKSTTGRRGTYSAVATIVPVGAVGAWDEARCSEPHIQRLTDGSVRVWFMGMDAGNTHEQIGYSSCPSGADIENPANWTKNPGNPLLGVAGAPIDEQQVIADPFTINAFGRTWLGYLAAASGGVASAVSGTGLAFATSDDGVTFTRRGALWVDDGLWPPGPSDTLYGNGRLGPNWRGHMLPLDNGDLLWPYGANYGSFGATGRRVEPRLMVIDPEFLRRFPRVSDPWQRIQSDSTDKRISKTGTGWTVFSATYMNGGTGIFSNVAGDRFIIDFNGTGVRVFSQIRDTQGMANLYLDGVRVATDIDLFQVGDGTTKPWGVHLVNARAGYLTPGYHRLEVEVSANKNPLSGGNFVTIDYVEVLQSGIGG